MKSAFLLSVASAATLDVTWQDCGAKHAKVTDVQPTTITSGTPTTLTGKGTVDESVTSTKIDVAVSAHGVKLTSCSGDGTSDITCKLPLGAGSITMKKLSFPLTGDVSIPVEVSTSALVPGSLASVDVHITASDQSGESVICLDVHTNKAATTWEQFKQQFGKVYNGDEEDQYRRQVFEENMIKAAKVQLDNPLAEMGATQFSDLTPEEFKTNLLGFTKPASEAPKLGVQKYSGATLPDSIDWSSQGAVTPIKNQGQCGSCWAFSTVGALEGRAEISTGKLQAFSEQQFVDCDKDQDQGCNGGLMDNAFKYAENNDICTEDSYSYKGVGGSCQTSSCTVGLKKGQVTGFVDVDATEDALAEAVAQGPVSVAVDAETIFQFYTGGVMSGVCGASLDHGVLVVGYGEDNGTKYWKVKNSWGSSWGESGYIRMKKGKGGKGQCGILTGPPSYPQIESSVSV